MRTPSLVMLGLAALLAGTAAQSPIEESVTTSEVITDDAQTTYAEEISEPPDETPFPTGSPDPPNTSPGPAQTTPPPTAAVDSTVPPGSPPMPSVAPDGAATTLPVAGTVMPSAADGSPMPTVAGSDAPGDTPAPSAAGTADGTIGPTATGSPETPAPSVEGTTDGTPVPSFTEEDMDDDQAAGETATDGAASWGKRGLALSGGGAMVVVGALGAAVLGLF